MTTLLVVNSSASGDASVSRLLVADAVAKLLTQAPQAEVIRRDLSADPVPHLTADAVMGVRGEPANEAQMATRALSDQLIAELQAADIIVIGAPMYNFGIPSTLKAWFDHLLRAGVTFKYSEAGPKGLLTGKRAIVVESRGGLYSEGPVMAWDSQEPHLRTLLGVMGITDVAFVRAEKLGYGPEARDLAIAGAKAELTHLAHQPLPLAA